MLSLAVFGRISGLDEKLAQAIAGILIEQDMRLSSGLLGLEVIDEGINGSHGGEIGLEAALMLL